MPGHSLLVLCTACILIVIVACMAAGCSSGPAPIPPATPSAPSGGGTTIAIKNFAFDPPVMTVKTGTAVTWMNQDGATHTLASDAGSPAVFSSEPLPTGASFTVTFTQPGTYPYHCPIHPSMKGTIIVQ